MLKDDNLNRKKAMTNATLYIIYFGVATRILLFYKDVLIASKIGANYKMDSYLLALGAIMLIATTIGEGLIVSIIPLIHQIKARDGKQGKEDYINNLINTTIVFSLLLISIGYIFAPIIIKLLGPGFSKMEVEKSMTLFRLGLPIIPLVWMNSIFGGYLQTDHSFKAGARGEFLSALIYIIYIMFFSERFGINGLMLVGNLAVIFQVYLRYKVMKVKNFKYEFKIDFQDKYLKKTIGFLLPILLGIGVNQANIVVDNAIASTMEIGSIAELNYANQVIQLFLGVFVTAIVTVRFPILTESFNKEICYKDKKCEDFNREIMDGIKILLTLAIPLSIILISLAEPMVKILFERGAFGLNASFFTSQALKYYAIGFIPMALLPLIIKSYYAMNDLKTPISISAIALIFNIGIDLILIQFMGVKGLALGTSISSILAVLYGLYDLNKKLKFIKNRKTSLD